MSRPIDHLVLATDGLVASRERMAALGFNVAPDAVHPFGTSNACVFFANRTYIEPLAIHDRQLVEAKAKEGLTFLRRSQAYRFRRGEGGAMLAMSSSDAAADASRFSVAGLLAGEFAFERPLSQESGAPTIGVRLAFAVDERTPDFTAFACEHIGTDNLFWTPERTTHPNGARGIVEVVATEPNPTDFQYLLEALCDERDLRATSLGIEADAGDGKVMFVTPQGFELLFGFGMPRHERGVRLQAITVAVDELASVRRRLAEGDTPFVETNERLVVPPAPGVGVFIAFVEERT